MQLRRIVNNAKEFFPKSHPFENNARAKTKHRSRFRNNSIETAIVSAGRPRSGDTGSIFPTHHKRIRRKVNSSGLALHVPRPVLVLYRPQRPDLITVTGHKGGPGWPGRCAQPTLTPTANGLLLDTFFAMGVCVCLLANSIVVDGAIENFQTIR